MEYKWTSVDNNQNNQSEETLSKSKRRPHSYLLNEKAKDSENIQPKEEKSGSSKQSDEKVPSNGAPLNQMEGKINTYVFSDQD